MKFYVPLCSLTLSLMLISPSAWGQSAVGTDGLIEVFGDWSAFAIKVDGKNVCYVGSEPQKAVGKYKTRGDTYILVTHNPGDRTFGVASLRAGYTYKADSEVDVTVGGFKQKLFTDGGHAWAYDVKADKALVRAMKNGSELTAKGFSTRGTLTTDTYSLKGFTAAYAAASKACGVKN